MEKKNEIHELKIIGEREVTYICRESNQNTG
jgi:hypothetical protein